MDPPTELLVILVAGDCIVRKSSEKGKVSIMMIGCTDILPDSRSVIEIILMMIINKKEGEGTGKLSLEETSKIELSGQRTFTR